MLGKWTGPTCWVNLTQHVFCPLCNQRWVGKQPNLGWKQPSTFESVGNCYYRSTRKSIQTIFSDVVSLVKTCAKVRCLEVTFVSKIADLEWLLLVEQRTDQHVLIDWLIMYLDGESISLLIYETIRFFLLREEQMFLHPLHREFNWRCIILATQLCLPVNV